MGLSAGTGAVVIVPYPYSDLSQVRLRPAVVMDQSTRSDWILCQVPTNPYSDIRSIELDGASFDTGALRFTSYARPAKLFTAEGGIITRVIGTLRADVFNRLIDSIVNLMNQGRIT